MKLITKFTIVFIIVCFFVIFCTILYGGYESMVNPVPPENNETNNTNNYTKEITTIDGGEAHYIVSFNETNLTIIDCSGGCQACVWKDGYIPGSVWNDNPESFFNTTNDLLVYSRVPETSYNFCERLVNHTYGKIYYLDYGYAEWVWYESG